MWRLYLATLTVVCSLTGAPIHASEARPHRGEASVQLSGRVIDAVTGDPISHATVLLIDAGYAAESDHTGRFAFANLDSDTYSLQISAVGYKTRRLEATAAVPELALPLVIRLTPVVIPLADISVTARRTMPGGDRPIIIGRESISASRTVSVPDLLASVDGLVIQESGNGSQVRMRGGTANQVLVMVDGQKINASGTGVADLSTIPLEVVERIEIYKGGASSKFGPDAMAGAINIVTHPDVGHQDRSTDMRLQNGSYSTGEYAIVSENIVGSQFWHNRFAVTHRTSQGDFEYNYAPGGEGGTSKTYQGTRENNDSRNTSYFLSGQIHPFRPTRISYSAQWYDSRGGLPGSVSRPDLYATANDDRLLASAAFRYEGSGGHSQETRISMARYSQHYENTDSAVTLAYRFDTQSENNLFTLSHSMRQALWRRASVSLTAEYRRDGLEQQDILRPQQSMGTSSRRVTGAALLGTQEIIISVLGAESRATLSTALRFDHAYTDAEREATIISAAIEPHTTDFWSPEISATLTGGESTFYGVAASYGKSLRLPELNALYWRGGARSSGNPALRPEKSEHSEISTEIGTRRAGQALRGTITYFHSRLTDLVVWQAGYAGVWKPVNLGAAQITGHEESVSVTLFNEAITLGYQNAVTSALNKVAGHNSHNKRLVYYPRFLTTFSARLEYGVLYASGRVRRADKIYTNESNTRFYDGYTLVDLSVGAEFALSPYWTIAADIAAENVTDQDYVQVGHNPLPGREYALTCRLHYGVGGDGR